MKLAVSLLERVAAMSPGDRRALLIMTLFLLLVGGYVFLLEPLIIGYQQAHQELDELTTKQQAYLQKVRMLPRREAKLAEYAGELENLQRQFEARPLTREAAISNTISELTYYARLCEIEVAAIRPLDAESVGGYLESPVEIEAQGYYAGLHKFFYFVETSPSLLAITDLDLRPQQGGLLRARLKLSNIARLQERAPEAESVAGPRPQDRLRIILPPWSGYAPLVVAEQNGYFESPDYRIDLIRLSDALAAEQLLVSGAADGLGTTLAGLMSLRAQGVALKVVLPLAAAAGTEGILVAPGSDIHSVADLRQQRLAVDGRGVLEFVLYELLKENGLSLSDVATEQRQAELVAREMSSGTLEAGLTREPYLTALVRTGQARLLASSAEMKGLILDLLAMTPQALEGKSDALQFLVGGLLRAQDFILSNPVEAARIIAKWQGQPVDLTEEILNRIQFYDGERAAKFFGSSEMEKLTQAYEDYFRASGRPVPRIAAEEGADASILLRVRQSMQPAPTKETDDGGS